jgi:transposase
MERKFGEYATDVGDEEWAFCRPYLTLMSADAPQREYPLRAVFNALRYMVRAGCPWRLLPNDLPPWWVVHQQAMRWIAAACFEAMAHDLRAMLRIALGREHVAPTAAVLDSRTIQSTPESGGRAGYDGAKRRKGSKVHIAVDTLGHLLALRVTAADQQDRAQVGAVVRRVQQVTAQNLRKAFVDQGYTGETAQQAAARHGVDLEVIKLPEAKRGFVLLPRRWVVERTFAWTGRFRRLARDYERLATTLAGMHWLTAVGLMLAAIYALGSTSA